MIVFLPVLLSNGKQTSGTAALIGDVSWGCQGMYQEGKPTLLTLPLAVINASTLVSQDEVLAATAALQVQVHRDFAPAWQVDADLAVVVPGGPPPTGAWWIVIMDNSDLGAALGYHDLTSQGLPLGKVFVESSKKSGQAWTTLLSHEILEMLSDPFICLTALAPTAFGTYLYAYENCDACQSDQFGYLIGDQLVSDFCLPAWFDANRAGGAGPFDFKQHIKQPFALLPGGYAMCRNLSAGTGWTLVTAPGATLTYRDRPRVGSRRERRKIAYPNWLKSNVTVGSDFASAQLMRPRL
ncbi:hypothetical protein [Bradyrhizobium liaoningense]|uniref:hypothetical protein n=1 Tax=Bradyrhizobium liaoningense TaxID=43992 RepID=UPI001BA91127|nr:hypothetical protein [Bradyrhizobium liaoningense]MBR0820273.1 hypothetical protein [Bradyrhizobium liaoningense]